MAKDSDRTAAKFCPRCGAFYNDLQSKTCPQCFAPLEVLSGNTADALAAEQEVRKNDPEILALKQADDEKFKEQAFGGCFGISIVVVLTLVLSVAIIWAAMHRKGTSIPQIASSTANRTSLQIAPPQNVYLPAKLGNERRIAYYPPELTGALEQFPEYAADYAGGMAVFCVPATLSSTDLTQFRESTDILEDQRAAMHTRVEVVAHGLDYLVYAQSATAAVGATYSLSENPSAETTPHKLKPSKAGQEADVPVSNRASK